MFRESLSQFLLYFSILYGFLYCMTWSSVVWDSTENKTFFPLPFWVFVCSVSHVTVNVGTIDSQCLPEFDRLSDDSFWVFKICCLATLYFLRQVLQTLFILSADVSYLCILSHRSWKLCKGWSCWLVDTSNSFRDTSTMYELIPCFFVPLILSKIWSLGWHLVSVLMLNMVHIWRGIQELSCPSAILRCIHLVSFLTTT